MKAEEWIVEFLVRHSTRYAPGDWPKDRDVYAEYAQDWCRAFDAAGATEREADAASRSLILKPPEFRRHHIPAIIGAIKEARKKARTATGPSQKEEGEGEGTVSYEEARQKSSAKKDAWLALSTRARSAKILAMAKKAPGLARFGEAALAVACQDELAGEEITIEPWEPPPPRSKATARDRPTRRRSGLTAPAPNIYTLPGERTEAPIQSEI